MTFSETICALRDETKEMDIFAMIAYGDATVGMGIRASYYDELHNDPIIDGNLFMIAGDAFDVRTWNKIQTTRALNETPLESIRIRLRGTSCWPDVQVDLGDYTVENMKAEAFTEVAFLFGYQTFPERIRLRIKRRS